MRLTRLLLHGSSSYHSKANCRAKSDPPSLIIHLFERRLWNLICFTTCVELGDTQIEMSVATREFYVMSRKGHKTTKTARFPIKNMPVIILTTRSIAPYER